MTLQFYKTGIVRHRTHCFSSHKMATPVAVKNAPFQRGIRGLFCLRLVLNRTFSEILQVKIILKLIDQSINYYYTFYLFIFFLVCFVLFHVLFTHFYLFIFFFGLFCFVFCFFFLLFFWGEGVAVGGRVIGFFFFLVFFTKVLLSSRGY